MPSDSNEAPRARASAAIQRAMPAKHEQNYKFETRNPKQIQKVENKHHKI